MIIPPNIILSDESKATLEGIAYSLEKSDVKLSFRLTAERVINYALRDLYKKTGQHTDRILDEMNQIITT